MWDMTHSYVTWFRFRSESACTVLTEDLRHDSFMCAMSLFHMCVIWLIHTCETWLIHICETWLIQMWHDSVSEVKARIPCLQRIIGMTNSYVPWLIHTCVIWLMHICATWLNHMWHEPVSEVKMGILCLYRIFDMTHYICVTKLIQMCGMTHSYVWHDSFIYVTWLIHMCDMTHSYVWHDSFTCGTWLIHMWDMTHSYVGHDSFTCVTWLIWLIHICVTWLIAASGQTSAYAPTHMNAVRATAPTHMNAVRATVWGRRRHTAFICATAYCIHMCDGILHSYVRRHTAFICATAYCVHLGQTSAPTPQWACGTTHIWMQCVPQYAGHTSHMNQYVARPSWIGMGHVVYKWDAECHICMGQTSAYCGTHCIHMCDMLHSYVRHDSFILVTWLIHRCNVTHRCETHL